MHVVELLLHLHLHVLLDRSGLSVNRLRQQGTQDQQSGDGGAEASCAHSRSLHIDPDRPAEAVTGVSEMLWPLLEDHVLGPRQAFDFGHELTIGGRDAVSSSSAVVSDRVGSLSYHKPDHPTLNEAAALRPTRANCRWRSVPVCRGSGADNEAYRRHSFLIRFIYAAFPQSNRAYGGRRSVTVSSCAMRGRSSGKTAPPGSTLSPWYAGGYKGYTV